MSYIVVDVESDGPIIGNHSMVCFGAVHVDKQGLLNNTFYGKLAPISSVYVKDALAVSGFTRKEHEKFDDPSITMQDFEVWLRQFNNPTLISDNNGYDASWINYYFHRFVGNNPFGWSSRRLGDLFCGYYNDAKYQWKKHRITKHTHNPVDDAKGNAEALLYLINQGFKMKL